MSILVMGVACFAAALSLAPAAPSSSGKIRVGRGRALAWLALLALPTLGQLWAGADTLDRYRFTLLGFRYRIAEPDGSVRDARLSVAGDPDVADLYVPGAGDAPGVSLVPLGRDSLTGVTAILHEDAAAVGLVEVPSFTGSGWRVLGARAVPRGTLVTVEGPGGEWGIEMASEAARVPFLDARLPLPWVEQPVAVVRAPGSPGADTAVRVTLPPVEGSLLSSLRGARPSVFQRTYPLADVLAAADPAGALPPLGSFFFWDDGALHLADLDSELSVGGDAGEPDPVPVPVWSPDGAGKRLLVAGLPHRDWPEPDLTLPERYGLRPLRSFRIDAGRPWLDVALASPEIRTLDRDALAELRLPGQRDAAGRPIHRIRLTPGRNTLARRSVVFDAAPATFAAAGQAVFRLPDDPADGGLDVLTPSGLARWETGRPLALGSGDRALLVRVDGQGTSGAFWLAHLALFGLVAALFLARPPAGPVFALALAATGLACVRLVLGVSALAAYPYVQEGQQLGLWLLPLLPWALVALAEAARAEPADPGILTFGAWRRWGFHAAYAIALVALSSVLFPGSPAKAVVLALVPAGVVTLWLAARAGHRPWVGLDARLMGLARRRPSVVHGWTLGAGLLLLRVVLEGAGWREQLTVGGTRVGVSVFYTPLVVLTLAALLRIQDRRLRAASGGAALPAAVASALFEVGGFLVLAYVAVSGWVSDFGIALALLPGALVVVAMLGALRATGAAPARRTPRQTRAAVLALGLPLLLFSLVQAAPPLLRFAWGTEGSPADIRLGEWNRNELLLLERGDPSALALIGQRRSEALAVMRETMRSYTRGNPGGKGFLEGRVGDEIGETATREHAVSALLASQFGLPGTVGLILLLLALLPPVTSLLVRDAGDVAGAAGGEGAAAGGSAAVRTAVTTLAAPLLALIAVAYLLPAPFNTVAVGLLVAAALVVLLGPAFGVAEGLWSGADARAAPASGGPPADAPGRPVPYRRLAAGLSLYTLALAGIYMVLANYGLAFFTGKNVYLLGLDSVGDTLESLALLGIAALVLGREAPVPRPRPGRKLPRDREGGVVALASGSPRSGSGGASGRPPGASHGPVGPGTPEGTEGPENDDARDEEWWR